MNGVLIDSDILIEVLLGRQQIVVKGWKDLAGSDTAPICSPISMAEIWCGARPRETEVIQSLFRSMNVVPIDAEVGRRAAEYLARYSKSHGVELGDADRRHCRRA